MTLNQDNLAFSSNWEIDQLIDTQQVGVGSADSNVYTIPSSLTVPVFEVYFQPSGSAGWYLPGTNSLDGTTGSSFAFNAYQIGNQIHAITDRAGTVRIFIWKDRLNY
jgi:hypothetical protein